MSNVITFPALAVAEDTLLDLIEEAIFDGVEARIDTTAPARRTRRKALRPADFVDPIDGEHTWFTTDGAVIVPEANLRYFADYIRTRGMVFGGSPHDMFKVENVTLAPFDRWFSALEAIVKA